MEQKYKPGDEVLVLPTEVVGVITEYDHNDRTYRIRLKGSTSVVWALEHLLLVPIGLKCTCGLISTRSGGRHSQWCNVPNPTNPKDVA